MCWIDQEDKEPAMPCGGCKELICYDCQCSGGGQHLDKDVCQKFFCTMDDHGDWDYKSKYFYEGYGDPFYKGNDPDNHAVSKWHLNHRRMVSFCVDNRAPECNPMDSCWFCSTSCRAKYHNKDVWRIYAQVVGRFMVLYKRSLWTPDTHKDFEPSKRKLIFNFVRDLFQAQKVHPAWIFLYQQRETIMIPLVIRHLK